LIAGRATHEVRQQAMRDVLAHEAARGHALDALG
jgi:hypothetical protein